MKIVSASPTLHRLARLLLAVAAFALAGGERRACAQADEEKEDAPPAAERRGEDVAIDGAMQREWMRAACKPQVEQLRARALPRTPTERSPLERLLTHRITELKAQCALTDAQVKKLELAGKGDIKRFADRILDLSRKLDDSASRLEDLQAAFSDCESLKNNLNAGIFGDGSFLAKTLLKTLTPEQTARRARSLAEERQTRYERFVWKAVRTLQGNLALRDQQAERLARQLLAHSRPPREYGRVFEFAFVVFQLSRLPEDTIKPIFEDRQWRELQGWFAPYKGGEGAQILERDGFVFDNAANGAQPAVSLPGPGKVRFRPPEKPRPAPAPIREDRRRRVVATAAAPATADAQTKD
jgi:hypothetical protein